MPTLLNVDPYNPQKLTKQYSETEVTSTIFVNSWRKLLRLSQHSHNTSTAQTKPCPRSDTTIKRQGSIGPAVYRNRSNIRILIILTPQCYLAREDRSIVCFLGREYYHCTRTRFACLFFKIVRDKERAT